MNMLQLVFVYALALFSFFAAFLPFLRLKMPYGFAVILFKLFASAISPIVVLSSLFGIALGLWAGAPMAILLSGAGLLASLFLVYRILTTRIDFGGAFGEDWHTKASSRAAEYRLSRRWVGWLPKSPQPIWEQNIPFWTIPGTNRQLLCDIWQPPQGVSPAGLALIYFHGSAWYLLDKDFGTRPFFRHLAGQGYVVMDVAYRLAPETDLAGMAGDIKRAIAWMKSNNSRYGVDAGRIVIGGASAGGHLSMLCAYAPHLMEMMPEDVQGTDLSVRGVISEYGPCDLIACYYHTNQDKTTRNVSKGEAALPRHAETKSRDGSTAQRLGFTKPSETGAFVKLLGGHPDEFPEQYTLYSPAAHIHSGCPPTLLIQGDDDLITPARATRSFAQKLVECGVPVVNVVLPHTDHAFDLALPRLSPSAQSAIYVVDTFLALIA